MKKVLIWIALSLFATNSYTSQKAGLTISGGISLGVYEAGLNWVLVEGLRNDHQQIENAPELTAVTGASAGAINSIISALRYCEESNSSPVDDNYFHKTWSSIDIEYLLPEGTEAYTKDDIGVFDRTSLNMAEGAIKDWIGNGAFKPGCSVKIGIMVTKEVPMELVIKSRLGDYHEKIQAFEFPIRLTIDEHKKAKFYNELNYGHNDGKTDYKVLYLPTPNGGEINKETLIDVIRASSAFPIAFSPVQLEFCANKSLISDKERFISNQEDKVCPPGFNMGTANFTDGGAYNNIPIDLAIKLIEAKEPQPATYFYISPSQLRKSEIEKSPKQGLVKVMEALSTSLEGLQLQRKSNTILRYFDNGSNRELFVTRRNPFLTGNFQMHFGAFMDGAFRQYDYAAGVYDGLYNLAVFQCSNSNNKECINKKIKANIDLYLPENNRCKSCGPIRSTVMLLQYLENGDIDKINTIDDKSKHYITNKFIAESLYLAGKTKVSTIRKSVSIEEFAQCISQIAGGAHSPPSQPYCTRNKITIPELEENLRHIIYQQKKWQAKLLTKVADRLVELEKLNNTSQKNSLIRPLKLVQIYLHSLPQTDKKRRHWAMSAAPEKEAWYRIIPDSIGFDASQTGIALSWKATPRLLTFDNGYIELDGTLHHQIKDNENERLDYYSLGATFRIPRDDPMFSSFGFGPYINQNISNSSFDDSLLLGFEANAGFFADKVRFTIGTRDMLHNYDGEDWSVMLSINDLDSLLYYFSE